MADVTWDTVFKGMLALVVSPFLVTAIVKFAREWGVRGLKIDATTAGLNALVKKMDEFMALVAKDHTEIKGHVAKQSYILTGAEGLNGLRGDVKQLHDAFTLRNDADHAHWGEFGLWRLQSDTRLQNIERRIGEPDRRTTPRIVKDDRRKSRAK